MISRIKPTNIELKEQVFEIREFCRICGMDGHSGANYQYLRRTLKNRGSKPSSQPADSPPGNLSIKFKLGEFG
ncbi:MAG: hypothetical protein LBU32_12890 [Clostridiales bacterium]|nr:hypothetical protein [Clostridiales bacterium]